MVDDLSEVTVDGGVGRTEVVRNRVFLLEDVAAALTVPVEGDVEGVEQLQVEAQVELMTDLP